MTSISATDLSCVFGGGGRQRTQNKPAEPSYWQVCKAEGVNGLIQGLGSGATMAVGSSDLGTSALMVGGSAALNALTSCASAMWRKHSGATGD